ncbi:MAG: winged helix-turn-helix domain-containing protein [Acidobacteria bacterium]|nr:winged helix-turn-helix domain-containing protein [Acidobacteriota bacterium]MCL5287278.1 winged helix-turn-helix domain-containing protein [Acidobacteriota bacterium]
MLIQEVGETAGLIWQAIDSQGALKLTALKKQLKLNDTILHMALGWLAREDKIEMTAAGRTFLVQLK